MAATCRVCFFFSSLFFLVVLCPTVKDQLCADLEAADFLHMSLALEVNLGAAFQNNCLTLLTYTSVSKQRRVGGQETIYISSQNQGKGKKYFC